ncbi:MAG: hypothetical protein NZ730_05585 [Porticoccaceae bacterium]|nr:hypothetical protein [Porticoccaceae bacterium]
MNNNYNKRKQNKKNRHQKRKQKATSQVSLAAAAKKAGANHMLSFCPEHGPYTPDNLCACYAPGETLDYSKIMIDDQNRISGCACPIHGSYELDNLCPCYDESGNLRDDWDKDIKDTLDIKETDEDILQ